MLFMLFYSTLLTQTSDKKKFVTVDDWSMAYAPFLYISGQNIFNFENNSLAQRWVYVV